MAGVLAESPTLQTELATGITGLMRTATDRAGNEGVRQVIARRFAIYPQPQREEGEWSEWWAAYFDVLADTPLASLEAGMRAYVADPTSEFIPKPGKLKALAATTPTRSMIRYNRAREAVEAIAQMEREAAYQPPTPPTPAEIEAERAKVEADRKEILAMAETAISSLGAATKARKPLPSIAGIPDETGITPQMRELMNSRT